MAWLKLVFALPSFGLAATVLVTLPIPPDSTETTHSKCQNHSISFLTLVDRKRHGARQSSTATIMVEKLFIAVVVHQCRCSLFVGTLTIGLPVT